MRLFRVLPRCIKDKTLDEDESLFEREIDARETKKECEEHDLPADIITLNISDDKLYYLGCLPAQGPIYSLKKGVTII